MESTIIRKLKGSDMEYIFDNMSHIVNIKHYEGNTPHHFQYAPTKQYKYKITIRHAEGADAEQLFTDALNSLVKPKQGATTNKMSTKHTQGEWHVSKHGNNDSFGVYAEGNGNDLAIVIGGNEEGGETESNAKLIAAAPDMLKALQFVKGVLSNAPKGHYDGITMRAIDNAINKATNK